MQFARRCGSHARVVGALNTMTGLDKHWSKKESMNLLPRFCSDMLGMMASRLRLLEKGQ